MRRLWADLCARRDAVGPPARPSQGRGRERTPVQGGSAGRDREVPAGLRELPHAPDDQACGVAHLSEASTGLYRVVDVVRHLREDDGGSGLLRRCARCGQLKSEGGFHRSRTGQFSYCAECRREYDRLYYATRGRQARLERDRRRRLEIRAWLDATKREIPCADCGGTFPGPVMHWDHLPGMPKLGAVSTLAHGRRRTIVLAEIQKCELVCANCHAVRTATRPRLTADRSRQSAN